jgi:hypothetical protein
LPCLGSPSCFIPTASASGCEPVTPVATLLVSLPSRLRAGHAPLAALPGRAHLGAGRRLGVPRHGQHPPGEAALRCFLIGARSNGCGPHDAAPVAWECSQHLGLRSSDLTLLLSKSHSSIPPRPSFLPAPQLAAHDRTIVAVIHQPSSEVYDLFDKLCLLSGAAASGKGCLRGCAAKAPLPVQGRACRRVA